MNPTQPSRLAQPFAAWDIEAEDWNRFKCAALVTGEGDVDRFYTQEGLQKGLAKYNRRCYAHFGGKYDFFFLPPLNQIVLSGAGILKAKHGEASLYDSFMLFQMSLAKIGKAVGVEKYENKSNRVEELSLEETMEHCVQDCRVLAAALAQHQAWCGKFPHPQPRWPATAGATAVYVAEALESDAVAHLARERLHLDAWHEQACAVSGGRVEIFAIGEREGVYTYDINSSYPKSWIEAPLPLGPWVRVEHEEEARPGVYLCNVYQSGKKGRLPVVAPEHRWGYVGGAWVTSEELRALRDAGGEARVILGYVSETVGWFGKRFVDELYAEKLAGSPWAKVAINSLHGKFSQGILQGSYYRQKDGSYVQDRELSFPSWHQRPLVAAFVLARARLRLWQTMDALQRAGWEVFYCDTDCVHTNCPPEKFPGTLGDACGEWKLEAGPARAVYVAPKVYALEQAGRKTKVVCKGFPAKTVTIDTLLRAAKGEAICVTDRAGLQGFKTQAGWGAHVSQLSRTLTIQTGGKKHERSSGYLLYPDERSAR